MRKPAVIMVWGKHMDYPVARWNLTRFSHLFSSVLIGLSNHHQETDLSNFIQDKLPNATCFQVTRTEGGDWRNDAVTLLLSKTDAEDILFLEQDFLFSNETMLKGIFDSEHDFVYYKEHERIHPAFAFVRRKLVDQTTCDFAPHPPGDHFVRFFSELPPGVELSEIGFEKKVDYIHMAGLSQNYQSFLYEEPFYQPINFLYFNWKSLGFGDQHPYFLGIEQNIEKKYGHPKTHTYLDRFFPL